MRTGEDEVPREPRVRDDTRGLCRRPVAPVVVGVVVAGAVTRTIEVAGVDGVRRALRERRAEAARERGREGIVALATRPIEVRRGDRAAAAVVQGEPGNEERVA